MKILHKKCLFIFYFGILKSEQDDAAIMMVAKSSQLKVVTFKSFIYVYMGDKHKLKITLLEKQYHLSLYKARIFHKKCLFIFYFDFKKSEP